MPRDATSILLLVLPCDGRRDKLMWCPSPSGKISVKSCYNLIINGRHSPLGVMLIRENGGKSNSHQDFTYLVGRLVLTACRQKLTWLNIESSTRIHVVFWAQVRKNPSFISSISLMFSDWPSLLLLISDPTLLIAISHLI